MFQGNTHTTLGWLAGKLISDTTGKSGVGDDCIIFGLILSQLRGIDWRRLVRAHRRHFLPSGFGALADHFFFVTVRLVRFVSFFDFVFFFGDFFEALSCSDISSAYLSWTGSSSTKL